MNDPQPLIVEEANGASEPEAAFPIVGIGASAGGLEALRDLMPQSHAKTHPPA